MKQETYTDNGGNVFNADGLLPCPCCNGKAQIIFTGNNYTKTRSVKIKCSKCFLTRKDSALRHDAEWCARNAIEQWNRRIDNKSGD